MTSRTRPRSQNTSPAWPSRSTESVVAEGRRVTHVAVKVRTATFFTRTKISKLPDRRPTPTSWPNGPLVVLDRFELARPVRLLGVRVMLDLPVG